MYYPIMHQTMLLVVVFEELGLFFRYAESFFFLLVFHVFVLFFYWHF
jgi:hypothetical protein